MRRPHSNVLVEQLTARQKAVFLLLAQGKTNKEVADRLGCSVRTAQFHASSVLRKFGAGNRRDLLALLLRSADRLLTV